MPRGRIEPADVPFFLGTCGFFGRFTRLFCISLAAVPANGGADDDDDGYDADDDEFTYDDADSHSDAWSWTHPELTDDVSVEDGEAEIDQRSA
ncbi:hypothetical protein LSAT2_024681 [Lamellibrachia satsuma]|nr:hypothetical protein LSAT2_024681 [Lamellibrachia satsuma]